MVGDGPILVNGGGSFGDVYRLTQRFLHRIVETFPERRIVVLPQTVYFETTDGLEEAKRVIAGHPDLVLMCRDRDSFETARTEFDCDVQLVPDLAFALGPQPAPPPPHEPRCGSCVATTRRCRVPTRPAPPRSWSTTGRTSSRPSRGGRAGSAPEELGYRALRRVVGVVPQAHAGPLLPVASARRLAAARVDAAFALLARGECVVTDRLHGHLLATLLGRPSVVCDNSFGKVRSFYETWTQPLPGCAWAETPAGAEAVLDRLLSRGWVRAACVRPRRSRGWVARSRAAPSPLTNSPEAGTAKWVAGASRSSQCSRNTSRSSSSTSRWTEWRRQPGSVRDAVRARG